MKGFNDKEFKLYKKILGMTQPQLLKSMSFFLSKYYKNIVSTNDYIYAEGTIPIVLCAHLDTVFAQPPIGIFYDREANVIWSPQGAGHDDRAGVFMIMQLIGAGLRPHIVFTTDEEKGCVGAGKLVKAVPECPFEDVKYIVQLDRRGADDCVFYWQNNKEFVHYIEDFGFAEAKGSFTDIVDICPAWNVAGVNLSVGYINEHTAIEHLAVDHYFNTLNKVKKMLKNPPVNKFAYIEQIQQYTPMTPYSWGWDFGYETSTEACKCEKCHEYVPKDDTYPVNTKSGEKKDFCIECMMESVAWCKECNEPFETDDINALYCPSCASKRKENEKNGGKGN